MITLPWGEHEVREVFTMLQGASQSQWLLIAYIPKDSRWPIDDAIRGDYSKRAEWLDSMARDLMQVLVGLAPDETTKEREDDLAAVQPRESAG